MNIRNNPVLFKTNNSHYLYDDSAQIVIPITKEEKNFIESIEFQTVSDEYIKENSPKLFQHMCFYHLFKINSSTEKYTSKMISDSIEKNGIKSLVLTVDDSCNMRCKYCYFSDQYDYMPTYNTDRMDLETAKKAVDFYIQFNKASINSNPNLKFIIGFYGGEPLLNWEIIYGVVEYCRRNYSEIFDEIRFPITTNCLLLNKEKIKYMMENHFIISASFDGNEFEHNRNRVDINGTGTFNKVYTALQMLEEEYQNRQDKTGDSYYNILLTYDNKTDLMALNDFFTKHKWIDDKIFHINKVSPFNTTYYDSQKSEEIRDKFYLMQEKLIELYKNTPARKRTRFLNTYIKQMFLFLKIRDNYSMSPLKGSCIPGEGKLHVDPKGNFHTCEKINRLYPIGSLSSGFDIENQLNIVTKYLDFVETTCSDCNVKNLCSLCFALVQNEKGQFSIDPNICKAIKINISRTLELYYNLLEENITLMED